MKLIFGPLLLVSLFFQPSPTEELDPVRFIITSIITAFLTLIIALLRKRFPQYFKFLNGGNRRGPAKFGEDTGSLEERYEQLNLSLTEVALDQIRDLKDHLEESQDLLVQYAKKFKVVETRLRYVISIAKSYRNSCQIAEEKANLLAIELKESQETVQLLDFQLTQVLYQYTHLKKETEQAKRLLIFSILKQKVQGEYNALPF